MRNPRDIYMKTVVKKIETDEEKVTDDDRIQSPDFASAISYKKSGLDHVMLIRKVNYD
jgi:hypothetical protein